MTEYKHRFVTLDADGVYAMIIHEWDGRSVWRTQPGMNAIFIPPNNPVFVGWYYYPETKSFLPPPKPVIPDPEPRRISKPDFMRLFTPTEMVKYKMLRIAVANLTEADFVAAMGGDLVKLSYVKASVFFDSFDLVSMVELDHPETIMAVEQLADAGILGTPDVEGQEHIEQRVGDILAGKFPS